MLIMQHLDLRLDATLEESQPLRGVPHGQTNGQANGQANGQGRATSTDRRAAQASAADDWASVLPHRLLGAARLLSLTDESELTKLPVALADEPPALSALNEDAALRLVARACEAALEAMGGVEAVDDAEPLENGDGTVGEAQPAATGAKRRRQAAGCAGGRGRLGRDLCAQQCGLYEEALAEIWRRQQQLAPGRATD